MAITLNTKVYNGTGFNVNQQYVYKETSATYPSGFSYLTAKANTGTGKKSSVVCWNLSLPHVADAASTCACAGDVLGTDYIRIEVDVSAITSAADRLDIWTRLRDLVASTPFKDSITALTQPSA